MRRLFSERIWREFGLGVEVTKGQLGIVMLGFANCDEKDSIHVNLWDIWIHAIYINLVQAGINFLICFYTNLGYGIRDLTIRMLPVIKVTLYNTLY